jgi:hypothetical protein
MHDNPWFGTNARKTALTNAIAQEIRARGDMSLTGKAFFDHCATEAEKVLNPGTARSNGTTKVEGNNGRGADSAAGGGNDNRGGRGGKTFADLPAEAKAACERTAAKLVGKGRTYEKISDWRAEYARRYFAL